jgi:beta-N-acetylhexosaminidase
MRMMQFKCLCLIVCIPHVLLSAPLGQSLFLSLSTPKLSQNQALFLEKHDIRGIMLLGDAVQSIDQVSDLVKSIKKVKTSKPILVAIDQEGGRVSRLKNGIIPFPSALSLSKKGSSSAVYEQGRIIGATLAGLGIDINFAPVADSQVGKKNTVIGDRSYGSVLEVSTYSIPFAQGLLKEDVMPVFKHFPGHGRTIKDSHVAAPIVSVSRQILKDSDIRPFELAIAHGMPLMMTAHVIYPNFDTEYPATLSKILITDVLKGELGFKGKVISDDISMAAIAGKWSKKEAVHRALEAGVDYVLIVSDFESLESLF